VPRWDDAISWDGLRLTTSRPVMLDVGAAGKGYLVDLVCDLLAGAGLDDYVVDASGDLVHRGSEPLRVALEHPFDPAKAVGVYELSNGALCASAPNRRAWGNGLHHIVDAVTGLPTAGVAASWAMSGTGLVADGLATGLFFRDAAAFGALGAFEYLRMFPDGSAEFSRTFTGEIFT
jgi:thiamine biosynthesis lipoprotein